MKKRALPVGVVVVSVILLAAIAAIVYFSNASSGVSVTLVIHDSTLKQISVQDDGTVTFTEGDRTGQVKASKAQVDALRQSIIDNGFSSLDARYEGSMCCDFVANTINVTMEGKTRSVYCYNQCPPSFDSIKEQIIALWPNQIQYSGFS